MNGPKRMRPLSSDDSFVPTNFQNMLQNGGGVENTRDRMIVPDRIVVAGGDELFVYKPPPREITLDMYGFGPNAYVYNSLLETPPEKLTLTDRVFPAVEESDHGRQRVAFPSSPQEANAGLSKQGNQEIRNSQPEKPHHSSDDLPPTGTMSLLSPSEELVLLRNHVRKLTTRLHKLEEELQDMNRHVNWIEVLGGIGVLTAVVMALSAMRRL